MKKTISILLSIFTPLAAVPTGWAIYAGATVQPAFPMPWLWAVVGAIAIVIVTVATTDLLMDATKFNKSLKNQTERKLAQPLWWAWGVLGVAVISEITLSLFVVIWDQVLEFGVLVFPLLTFAGALAFALRMNLQDRESERDALRAQSKRSPRTRSDSATQSANSATHSNAQSDAGASTWPHRCEYCDADAPDSIALLQKPQSKGGHMKKHHPELCEVKALPIDRSLLIRQEPKP